jgi:hypothetical protein
MRRTLAIAVLLAIAASAVAITWWGGEAPRLPTFAARESESRSSGDLVSAAVTATPASGGIRELPSAPKVAKAPPRLVTVRGRVLAASDRSPIVGATIHDANDDDVTKPPLAVTGADGGFEVERDATHGECSIGIVALGRLPHSEYLELGEAAAIDREFVLQDGSVLSGRVVEHGSGLAVADAAIHIAVQDFAGGEVARSAEDGTFAIVGALQDTNDPWNWFRLEVSKLGFVGSTFHPNLPERQLGEAELLEMRLIRACGIEGEVRRENGAPVAGATVLAVQWNVLKAPPPALVDWPEWLDLGSRRELAVRTDEAGRYRNSAIVPYATSGGLLLQVGTTSYSKDFEGCGEPGSFARVDWVIPDRRARLAGRVTLNGEPFKARVYWLHSEWRSGDGVDCGKDGRFTFENVIPGTVRVTCQIQLDFEPVEVLVEVTDAATAIRDFDVRVDLTKLEGRVELLKEKGVDADHDDARKVLGNFGKSVSIPSVDPAALRVTASRLDESAFPPSTKAAPKSATPAKEPVRVTTLCRADGTFTIHLPTADFAPWDLEVEGEGLSTWNGYGVHSGATRVRLIVAATKRSP